MYILLAILGLGFLAIGLLDNWSGSDWIIALVLSILCWLPGVIYAFVKMKNYYS
ncbi:MAG: YqaE/Pmp3 family membrane protein [Bacteroidetes bacterium]|nr:MAG: YqaE/Pmp3 family membrane protein [Bacteroidota bacterium]